MEKAKSSGLIHLLVGFALKCAVCVCLIVVLWWLGFCFMLNSERILPADTAEKAAQQAARQMEKSGTFSKSLVPNLCGYALLDQNGAILETSLSGEALEDAQYYKASHVNRHRRYHVTANLNDTTCVFQYRIRVEYAAESLRGLPEFESLSLTILFVLIGFVIYLLTAHTVHCLKRGLLPLSATATQLANGDLETEPKPSSIREFNDVLQSLHYLQTSLKDSLKKQWEMEHNRISQMDALVHDLRTPLTVIGGNAQLLEETELSEEQRESLEAILRSCQSAQDYVDSLRGLTRLSSSGKDSKKVPVDGTELMQFLRQDAQEICRLHQVELRFRAQEFPQMKLNPQEIRRAVSNLVQNAAEYSKEGGTVSCECAWDGEACSVTVIDSGPGFTDAALRRGKNLLFTENEGRTPGGHSGLGLAFADSIAKRCGGSLTLSNTPEGHGQTILTLLVQAELEHAMHS